MTNSLVTTVATPSKCPGRCTPQSGSASDPTRTRVCSPAGYISEGVGANTASAPAAVSFATSPSRSRGYFARSSVGPNCVGLTKIVAATNCARARASETRRRCPSWSAPIVGTRPTRLPEARAPAHASRKEERSWRTRIIRCSAEHPRWKRSAGREPLVARPAPRREGARGAPSRRTRVPPRIPRERGDSR
jgi:hypothetical protein